MDLMSLNHRATRLLIYSGAIIDDSPEGHEKHLDDIDNFLNSLGKPLRVKYRKEWWEIIREAKKQKIEGGNLHESVFNAHALLSKVIGWLESLGNQADSPSRRSKQLYSMLNTEIPDLIKSRAKSKKLITETFDRFLKLLIKENPEHADELESYRSEFMDKSKSLLCLFSKFYLRWLHEYGDRLQLFFDNQCLANEYEKMSARKDPEKPSPSSSPATPAEHNSIMVSGDYVAGPKIGGHNFAEKSINVVDSQQVVIDLKLLNDLSAQIEKHYHAADKKEVIELADEIKELAVGGTDKTTLVKKLGYLLSRTAEVATIVGFIGQLIKGFS